MTDLEYTAALRALTDCVEATGAEFSIEFDRNENPRFCAFGRTVGDIVDKCLARHIGPVEFAWADQHAPTPEDEAAFYNAVVSCVETGLGLEFGTVEPRSPGSGPDTAVADAAIAADPDLYSTCFELQIARDGG